MQSIFLHSTALTCADGRARLACVRALWLLCLAALWLPGWALAAFIITRSSAPLMYIASGGGLRGAYVVCKVTSSTAAADVWVDINSFTGGVISLAPNEDGIVHLGAFSAGQTVAGHGMDGAYTLVYRFKAVGTTTAPTAISTPHPADRAHQKREPDEFHLHTYASPRPPERRATHL